MSKQPHAALSLPVQGAVKSPTGSGTFMDTANDVLGKVLGSSTSTSPSSTKADNEAKQSSSEAETVIFETAKLQVNILNKSEPSGRSSDGGVDSADIDQPGPFRSRRCQSRQRS